MQEPGPHTKVLGSAGHGGQLLSGGTPLLSCGTMMRHPHHVHTTSPLSRTSVTPACGADPSTSSALPGCPPHPLLIRAEPSPSTTCSAAWGLRPQEGPGWRRARTSQRGGERGGGQGMGLSKAPRDRHAPCTLSVHRKPVQCPFLQWPLHADIPSLICPPSPGQGKEWMPCRWEPAVL